MDWPTIRELVAYVFGNALGMAAAAAFVLGVWEFGELMAGLAETPFGVAMVPFGVVGLLGSGAVAYWWLSWAIREYVGPAADRARTASSEEGLGADSRT